MTGREAVNVLIALIASKMKLRVCVIELDSIALVKLAAVISACWFALVILYGKRSMFWDGYWHTQHTILAILTPRGARLPVVDCFNNSSTYLSDQN